MDKNALVVLVVGTFAAACTMSCVSPQAVNADETVNESLNSAKNNQSSGVHDQRNQESQERNVLAAEALANSDYVTAEALYKENIEVRQSDATAWRGLVKLYEAQGRKEEAREALRVLVTDHESWGTSSRAEPTVLIRFAVLCDETYRPEEAVVAYKEVLQFGKKSPGSRFPKVETSGISGSLLRATAHLVAGFSYSGYGQNELALDHYQRASQIADGFSLAHFYYACELKRHSQLDLAKSEFERAVSLDPNNELLVAEASRRLKEIGYALEGTNKSR